MFFNGYTLVAPGAKQILLFKIIEWVYSELLYWYKCTEYTTHMRVHAILKVGLGITKYHKAPSFLAFIMHRAFPLEAHNHGSPEQLGSKPRRTIHFQFGVSLDVFQNRSIIFMLLSS